MKHALHCMEVWGGNTRGDREFQMPGSEIWLHSRPVANVLNGGDVYYLSSCASGRISRLLLADVCGHGTRVSDLASQLRRLMHRHINRVRQADFIQEMNNELTRISQDGYFATALVGTFFSTSRSLQICSAGHPRPLLFRQAPGRWEVFPAGPVSTAGVNLPLGIVSSIQYSQTTESLQPGDMILGFTDGLTDLLDRKGEPLGVNGLLQMVRSLDTAPPRLFLTALLANLEKWAAIPAKDDLSVLLMRANGSGASLQSTLLAPFRMLKGSRDSTEVLSK